MNKFITNLQNTKSTGPKSVTYIKLFRFFIPLGTSTLLIVISNMLLNRSIGFLPNSELYISSFSVARSFLILFMSPVSAITLIFTAFIDNRQTYRKVKKYAIASIIVLQIFFLILAFTPLGKFALHNVYNLDGELLDNAILSYKLIVFLPIFFFLRNYHLGIAIKLSNVKFATIGSLVRLILILTFSFFIPQLSEVMDPKYIPAFLLSLMIITESLVYILGVLRITKGKVLNHLIQSLKDQNTFVQATDVRRLSYKKILYFSLPLILSFTIAQIIPSITQSALALVKNQAIVLTLYTVSISVINIVGSFSFQLPQVVVNHDFFNPKSSSTITKFCIIIAGFMMFVMAIVAFTKAGNIIFVNIMNLSESYVDFAKLALKFGILYPASLVFLSYNRGKIIKIHKTSVLIFERLIASLLPFFLYFIIPKIPWEYGAAAGIAMITLANLTAGTFSSIVFRISIKKNPDLINRTL